MGRARSFGSAQQSVCLSCHDGHLSYPQSGKSLSHVGLGKDEKEDKERRKGGSGGRGKGCLWRGMGVSDGNGQGAYIL